MREEHYMILDSLRRLLDDRYPPEEIRRFDEQEIYPRQILDDLAELGLTGLLVDEQYGGMGRDVLGACLVTEELAKRSLTLAWVYVGNAFFGAENISHLGSEEQKQQYLPALAKGESVFAYALTEPDCGSDVGAIKTSAKACEEGYLLNGRKQFISGASESDHILALVRTDKSAETKNSLSFFIVDSRSPGIEFRTLNKLGCNGSDTCEVLFDDVTVPESCLLGGAEMLNQGWSQLLRTLDVERVHLGAEAVGLAQGAFDLACDYIKDRTQFGRPLSSFQAIRHKVADLASRIDVMRVYTHHIAEVLQTSHACTLESSICKLFTTENARSITIECLQLFGGNGYMMEYDIQRYVRDALVLTIGGGTSEIQRNNIAKALRL